MTSPAFTIRPSAKPPLEDGAYRLEAHQTVTPPDAAGITYRAVTEFAVQGPRFTVTDGDVDRRHPPADVHGAYDGAVPHIAFTRATLPWERSVSDDPSAPWLSLLLFTETEWSAVRREVWTLGADLPEPGQRAGSEVAVLALPEAVWRALAPTAGERSALCHVRDDGAARAVVLSNRIVRGGLRHIACLVSGESVHTLGLVPPSSGPALGDGEIAVVLLHSWSFVSTPAKPDLHAASRALDTGDAGQLRIADPGRTTGDRIDRGFVPLVHRDTHGAEDVGWYRGPLKPRGARDQFSDVPMSTAPSDEADPDFGMPALSGRAAWELGRMLGLADPQLGSRLLAWRRRRRHDALRMSSDAQLSPVLDGGANADRDADDLRWFATESLLARLTRLEGVPYRYLVPDARLLPAGRHPSGGSPATGALRIVDVDRSWVQTLFLGALSIGRTHAADVDHDRAARASLGFPEVELSGFLLRASWLSDAPLEVAGRKGATEVAMTAPPRLLAPDLLFGLCPRGIDALVIHTPQESVHYGVDVGGPAGAAGARRWTFEPAPTGTTGGSAPPWPDEVPLRSGAYHPDVIAVERLAAADRTVAEALAVRLLHPARQAVFSFPS